MKKLIFLIMALMVVVILNATTGTTIMNKGSSIVVMPSGSIIDMTTSAVITTGLWIQQNSVEPVLNRGSNNTENLVWSEISQNPTKVNFFLMTSTLRPYYSFNALMPQQSKVQWRQQYIKFKKDSGLCRETSAI